VLRKKREREVLSWSYWRKGKRGSDLGCERGLPEADLQRGKKKDGKRRREGRSQKKKKDITNKIGGERGGKRDDIVMNESRAERRGGGTSGCIDIQKAKTRTWLRHQLPSVREKKDESWGEKKGIRRCYARLREGGGSLLCLVVRQKKESALARNKGRTASWRHRSSKEREGVTSSTSR